MIATWVALAAMVAAAPGDVSPAAAKAFEAAARLRKIGKAREAAEAFLAQHLGGSAEEPSAEESRLLETLRKSTDCADSADDADLSDLDSHRPVSAR